MEDNTTVIIAHCFGEVDKYKETSSSVYTKRKQHIGSHSNWDTMHNLCTAHTRPNPSKQMEDKHETSPLAKLPLANCNCWKRETQFPLQVLILIIKPDLNYRLHTGKTKWTCLKKKQESRYHKINFVWKGVEI